MEELSYPLLKVPFEKANKSFRLFHKQITREMISIQKAIDEINTQQDQINALTNISEQIFHIQEKIKRFLTAQEAEIQVSMDRSKFLQQNEESDTKEKHHNRLITDYLLGTGHVKSAKQFMEIKELDTLVEYKLHIECQSILKDLKQHQLLTAITWCTENGSRLRRLQSPLEFTLRLQEFLELVRSDCKLEAIQYAQTYLTPLSMQYEDKEIQKNMMEAIQEAMATLAYKTPSDCGKDTTYARLFAVERWEMLQETFRTTFCEVYGIHNPSSLWIALYAGLSSLNTRMCRRTRDAWEVARATNESVTDGASSNEEGRRETSENKRHNESQSPQRNKKSKLLKFQDLTTEVTSNRKHHNHMVKIKSDKGDSSSHVAPPLCPTCSDIGSQLVKGLPFAHHPHSRLVCRITETVMDHSNPPFVLPNGHVYSRQAIDRLVKDNIPHASTQGSGSKSTEITSRSSTHDTNKTSLSTHGIITCPETQEIYSMADLKPVFII